VHREVGNRAGEAEALLFRARLCAAAGRPGDARARLELARARFVELGEPQAAVGALIEAARLACADRRWGEAAGLLDRAETRLGATAHPFDRCALLCARGHLRLGEGRRAEAAADCDTAEGIALSLGVGPDAAAARGVAALRAALAITPPAPG